MPSTTSSVVSVVRDSSTVMTPSPPTFSMASATSSPIAGSLCAEIVATCAFSLRTATGRESAFSASTARLQARSRPRLRSIALAPATTLRTPSANIACASSVAVLVPSPTASPVFSAACRSICAPRFSSASLRSNSLAIVTPSLQTIGVPHFFWISTDLDFGPSVMRTASANWVAPRTTFSRAAERNRTCLCAIASLLRAGAGPRSARRRAETVPGAARRALRSLDLDRLHVLDDGGDLGGHVALGLGLRVDVGDGLVTEITSPHRHVALGVKAHRPAVDLHPRQLDRELPAFALGIRREVRYGRANLLGDRPVELAADAVARSAARVELILG